MKTYRVVWEIDVEATSARDAAKQAMHIQKRPFETSMTHFFDVIDKNGKKEPVDLDFEKEG